MKFSVYVMSMSTTSICIAIYELFCLLQPLLLVGYHNYLSVRILSVFGVKEEILGGPGGPLGRVVYFVTAFIHAHPAWKGWGMALTLSALMQM